MNTLPSLAAPIMCHLFEKHPDEYIRQLKQAGVGFVWLAPNRSYIPEVWESAVKRYTHCAKMLENAGFSVGIWITAFGFGTPIPEKEQPYTAGFTQIIDLECHTNGDAFCPTNPHFAAFLAESVKSCAKAGAKIIMLDDDLCLNIRPGLGCACARHMAAFEKRLGRCYDRENLKKIIYTGSPTPERRAWLESQGDSLREFCKQMRDALNEVDPTVRLGFCAGYTSFDLEGADALELSNILAGDTKPFLRLTGAPYWAKVRRFAGQSMNHIVEFIRMQLAWSEDSGVDVFYENDSYPRPTYSIPAALVETLDFCLAADGCKDQLKYIFDYCSAPQYEKGYLNAHLYNQKLIADSFEALKALSDTGVYIHEQMHKNAEMTLPKDLKSDAFIMQTAFSAAANLLSGIGISITYRNHGGITAAFGDAGRTVPLDQKGYILDVVGAMELQKRGVDVGVKSMTAFPVPLFQVDNMPDLPEHETFLSANDRVSIGYDDFIPGTSEFCTAVLCDDAVVESTFGIGSEQIPASYRYTNADGVSFLVFLFRADSFKYMASLACSYHRQQQILNFLQDNAAALPAVIRHAPHLWMLCKQDEKHLGIALCNFSEDMLIAPVVELAENYRTARFIGLSGKLNGNKITLDTVHAYRFGTILLEK